MRVGHIVLIYGISEQWLLLSPHTFHAMPVLTNQIDIGALGGYYSLQRRLSSRYTILKGGTCCPVDQTVRQSTVSFLETCDPSTRRSLFPDRSMC